MTLSIIIALASKNLSKDDTTSFAKLCLDVARVFEKKDVTYARDRALESIACSVGTAHLDYRIAMEVGGL